jgi:KDO2-lipid IV(A) lauroyltransferase
MALGAWLAERLRARPDIGGAMPLHLPEPARLDALAGGSGGILVTPHTAATLPMVQGLGRRYPVTLLVRTTRDRRRSASQHAYYASLGCEIVDARGAGGAAVARKLVRALRAGHLIIGMGDLIASPPAASARDGATELFAAEAFGQTVGVVGWPARFARNARVPLVPAIAVFDAGRIVLHLGPEARGDDPASVTRSWFSAMLDLIRDHPEDWLFALDRRWSRVLTMAAEGMPTTAEPESRASSSA